MDMFIVLNVAMVSEVYTIVKILQIRNFKYWQFIVWQQTSFKKLQSPPCVVVRSINDICSAIVMITCPQQTRC